MRFSFAVIALGLVVASVAHADEYADYYAMQDGNVRVFQNSAHGVSVQFRYPSTWTQVGADSAGFPRFAGDSEGNPQCGATIVDNGSPITVSDMHGVWIDTNIVDDDSEFVISDYFDINGVEAVEFVSLESSATPMEPRAQHIGYLIPRGTRFVLLDCSLGDLPSPRQDELFRRYIVVFRVIARTLSVQG